jgi:ureidoacrylate peracid hydrolase
MHRIGIPEHILARPIARRGRAEIFDALDPASTALIVVDMQKYFLEPGGLLEVPASRDIVGNINRLARALRSAGGLVCWTRHSFVREWSAWYGVLAKGEFADAMVVESAPGSPGFDVHNDLEVQPNDVVVDKTRYSAMLREGGCDLADRLAARGIDTVIVAGTLTNVCCESTARDAMMMNYKVVFVSDANATRSDAEHNATLSAIVQVVGDVRATDEVVRMIEAGVAAAAE